LDSVNLVGGPTASAPGADDNGSGSAGVLELARVLAATAWESDVRLILFGGEEQGLHGSRQHVAGLAPADLARIRAVLNMDMVGTRNTAEPAVLLEGAPVSQQLIDDLAAAAATYTGLRVETSLKPFASDHVPFIDAGVPAVLSIEGADSANGNIHTAADTLDHIDLELMQEILRMNLAALVGWLHPAAQSR
jgi:Zn-dependent M28 family amino/carboxypeptidase